MSEFEIPCTDFPTFLVLFALGTIRPGNDLVTETDSDQLERVVDIWEVFNEGNQIENPLIRFVSGSSYR